MGNCIKWENVEGSLQYNILNGTSPITLSTINGEKLKGFDGTTVRCRLPCALDFQVRRPRPGRTHARTPAVALARAHVRIWMCVSGVLCDGKRRTQMPTRSFRRSFFEPEGCQYCQCCFAVSAHQALNIEDLSNTQIGMARLSMDR